MPVDQGQIEQQVLEMRAAEMTYREIADQLPVSPTTAWRIQKKHETGPQPVLRSRARHLRVLIPSPGMLLAAALLLLAATATGFALYRALSPPAPAQPDRITACVHRGPGGNINGFTSGAGGCLPGWNTVALTPDPAPSG